MTSPFPVIPARLSFLGIYNPTLGPTDETFADQLVFWYSRAADEASRAARRDGVGSEARRELENEKLRQIGLAQGIVDFARTFSGGRAVDSVDTEKSRIVMHELEPGWWVLASIDLTRLPVTSTAPTKTASKKANATGDNTAAVEYSSREVSPAPLLIQQIVQAHHVFQLHNGPSLNEIFVRQSRSKLCNLLERFWIRFARSWDVLLHGNPSADLFSGLILSGGGELGMGVGEEEWGSGERDVLEDLTRRTEGLVDVIVSRFGDPVPAGPDSTQNRDELPWMGSGNLPQAHDGVIFGGSQNLSRPSLRNLSIWMRQVYTYGEHAYGVRDHPSRERRKRRQKPLPTREPEPSKPLQQASKDVNVKDWDPNAESNKPQAKSTADARKRPTVENRTSSSRSGPRIPAPIAVAVEQALDKATRQAESDADHESMDASESGTTMGIPDQYMKYLTFGLSTLAKPAPTKRPTTRRESNSSENTIKPTIRPKTADRKEPIETGSKSGGLTLAQVDPIPDGEPRQAKLARQRHLENKGHFVIGSMGDLDDVKSEDDSDTVGADSGDDSEAGRILIRTVYLELTPERVKSERLRAQIDDGSTKTGLDALDTTDYSPPSSGNDATINYRRLRVVLYARRPFLYTFLFANRTSSLQLTGFYKSLHQSLLPIHKPLLSSTSPARLAERIAAARAAASSQFMDASSPHHSSLDASAAPIYDLIYDPQRMTLHTSIPNIPEPGTPAAEGLSLTPSSRGGSNNKHSTLTSAWTRIEALNVHSQVLATLTATSFSNSSSTGVVRNDLERTSKTSRGWWIVWLRLSPSEADSPLSSHNPPNSQRNNNKNQANDPSFDNSTSSSLPGPPSTTAPSQRIPLPSKDRVAILVRNGNLLPPPPPTSNSAQASSANPNSNSALQAHLQQQQQQGPQGQTQGSQDGFSRAAASMWSALSLRSGSGSSASFSSPLGGGEEGRGLGRGGAAGAAGALGGGIGVDARGWVEGVLGGLNR